jgi:hypothetical protein
MAFDSKGLDDYVDVAARIVEFRAKYPVGYLAPLNPAEPFKLVQAQGFEKSGDVVQQTFVVVVAAAYREPGDECPGVGMAWEVFPGRTPYTRGSELMNAETSAWGRAIIALGAADAKRGIASQEEVRNRAAERDDPPARTASGNGHASGGNPPPEVTRGSTYDQQRQIAIRLAKKGIGKREDKLAFCGHTLGREVRSTESLSYLEATEILKAADALDPVEAK